MLVVSLAAVCLGLIAEAPGLGIFVSLMLVPALVHTAQNVRQRELAGEKVSVATKAGLLLGSFGLAIVLIAVIGIAAFCTLCGVCLTFVSVGTGGVSGIFPGLLLCCVGTGAIMVLVFVHRRLKGGSYE